MKRTEVIDILSLAALALLREADAVVPIFKGFRFQDGFVSASNDIVASCLPIDLGVNGLIPGRQLLRFLSACTSKEVSVEEVKKNVVLVKCGRSKLTVPTTPAGDWPFEFPDVEDDVDNRIVKVDDVFFNALALCSDQVSDRGLGSWLGGVKFIFSKGLKMYGVNSGRSTISYFNLQIPVGKSKIKFCTVPSSFCKLAISMSKKIGTTAKLYVTREAVVLQWPKSKGILASKLIEVDSPNVMAQINRTLEEVDDNLLPITPGLTAALKRASVVGADSLCEVVAIEGALSFKARSEDGALLRETVKADGGILGDVDGVVISADLLVKAIDGCDNFMVSKESTVLRSDAGFNYIVANRSSLTKAKKGGSGKKKRKRSK